MSDIEALKHRYRAAGAPETLRPALRQQLADIAVGRARWPWIAAGTSAALALIVAAPLLFAPEPTGVPSMLELARSLPARPVGSIPSIGRVALPTRPRLPNRPPAPSINDKPEPVPADGSGTSALPPTNTKEKTA